VTLTVVYTGVAGTPTLSQWMLLALAAMLPLVAFRAMRRMKLGGPFATITVAISLFCIETLTVNVLVPSAFAVNQTLNLSSPTGGTLSQPIDDAFNYTLSNTTGVTLTITSVTSSGTFQPTATGCRANTPFVLVPSASCNVNFPQ